jgi:superfamily II DNA or RNA helicase
MLKDFAWKGVYRSDTSSLMEDFYLPALRRSISYDRAVGYFSATMLSYAAQGVSALVDNDGRMRLVFGGELEESDAAAIADGYAQRELSVRLGRFMVSVIDDLADALTNQRLAALAWLIANGRLDIKVALKRRGMYHEKIGIFTDTLGDQLVFQGSANETTHALLPDFNFESINVFPSWRAELKDHFQPYIDGFERLWQNATRDTLVLDFPEAARERLVKVMVRNVQKPSADIELDVWRRLVREPVPNNEAQPGIPRIPKTYKGAPFRLADHQRAALNAWKSRDFRGILAMATGSGKTVTSIYGLVRLFEKAERLFVVVAVPYQALADQWIEELGAFDISAVPCYESTANWAERLSREVTLFETGALRFAACLVVNRTLSSAEFQQRIARVPGDLLAFLGDECHHHSGAAVSAALPQDARIRLGLSATPSHYLDDSRTTTLTRYYGDVVYEYSMAQALQDGVLTPYRYYVHFVELTSEEAESYVHLSDRIAFAAMGGAAEDADAIQSDELKMLLFKRARLLGNAENKLKLFRQLIAGRRPSPFHLFYCGDGVDDDAEDGLVRQVDQVSKALYDGGWKVAHFTARENAAARRSTLDSFKVGLLHGLVAIRCLDEGVDIPDCREAYILASSRNPKQFIQRRGRILRRAPNKEFAVIHDLLVSLPDGSTEGLAYSRRLLVAELQRVAEFGRLSTNRDEVYQKLKPLLEQYDLEHHFV